MTRINHPSVSFYLFALRRSGCLLILLSILQGAYGQPVPPPNHFDPTNCLSQTANNRPQWEDVGLHDILFAIGQPTVPAPNHVRLPYDYAPSSHYQFLLPHLSQLPTKTGMTPKHKPKGSLYLWHFLRL